MSSTEEPAIQVLAAAVAPHVLRLLLEQARAPRRPDTADADGATREEVIALLDRLSRELDG